MFKRVMVLTLAMLLVIPAVSTAKDMTGKWGLGYYHDDAPVGARFWLSPKVGLDVGVGFSMYDVTYLDESETATDFYLEAGVPFVVFPTERANFYIRPSVQASFFDENGYNNNYKSAFAITLAPGVEFFLTDNLSLEAAHGISYEMWSPREEEGEDLDSETYIYTFGDNMTQLGFHFYFK